MAAPHSQVRHVALIGLGTIGISFAALYLRHTDAAVAIFDPRPDLAAHLEALLPRYLGPTPPERPGLSTLKSYDWTTAGLLSAGRLRLADSLEAAVAEADIVQEQGPENTAFKARTWAAVERAAPAEAHCWSSTSGIPVATMVQAAGLADGSRLLVVHPFNPPHVLPLIEISPGPATAAARVAFARDFFAGLGSGHQPIVLRKEVPGFVGNRLAFALFREACHLVREGVIGVADLDTLVEASLGPRWAVQGPFRSYALGGGAGGLGAFMANLSGSIQTIWDDQGAPNVLESDGRPAPWVADLVAETDAAYGLPTPADAEVRDRALARVIQSRKEEGR